MGNAIPEVQRTIVRLRDKGRCVRCGGRGTDWHHRRSRLVRDSHQHCACNGVLLCRTCHQWVHDHPLAARGEGLIISKYVTEPSTVPYKRAGIEWFNTCKGRATTISHNGNPENGANDE